MTPEQIERKRAKQRECMRRLREGMTPDQLEAKRQTGREYMRRARIENPEAARAVERRYREAHREELAFRSFCRDRENPEAATQRKAVWRKANQERNRQINRESAKRCAARPENRIVSIQKARRRYVSQTKDKAALWKRIAAAAESAARTISAELRLEVISRLVEGVYIGRFPVQLKPQHAAEAQRDYFRQFSKFDTVSLDEVIGENGFTRGHALGVL